VVNLQAVVMGAPAGGFFEFPRRITFTHVGPVLAGLWARGAARRIPQSKVFRVSRSAVQSAAARKDFCTVTNTAWVQNYTKEMANVDSTFMRYSGVDAYAHFETSTNTTFSVGVSGSGNKGSFTASGTWSFSSTTGYDFGHNHGPSAEHYQMEYVPSEYELYYTPGYCFGYYYTQPSAQTGGHGLQFGIAIPSTPTQYCVQETPNATWYKASTQATTIEAGLTVSEIDFTASAQTGWTSTDIIYYENTDGSYWHLCGVLDYPGNDPGRVVAGLP
jgi:hypothetical protein